MKKIITFFLVLLIAVPLYAANTAMDDFTDDSASVVTTDYLIGYSGTAGYRWTIASIIAKALEGNAATATTLTNGDKGAFTCTDGTCVLDVSYQSADSDLTYLAGFTPSDNVKTLLNAANNAAIKSALGYYTSGDAMTGTITGTASSEIDGHATGNVTLIAGADNIIHNIGQSADTTLTLSAVAANTRFVFAAGEDQANFLRLDPNASDKICLIASDGSVTCGADGAYVGLATVAIGNMISCRSFKTGASAYDWLCGGVSGTWTAE